MTTPILGIPEVSDGQVDQFLVYNNALRSLEASTNDFLSVSLASADLTLSSAQFTSVQVFRTTGNAVTRTLTVPASKRLFIVNNGGSAALNVTRGSTTFSVSAGNYSTFYTDGTTNGLAVVGGGGGDFRISLIRSDRLRPTPPRQWLRFLPATQQPTLMQRLSPRAMGQ